MTPFVGLICKIISLNDNVQIKLPIHKRTLEVTASVKSLKLLNPLQCVIMSITEITKGGNVSSIPNRLTFSSSVKYNVYGSTCATHTTFESA